MNAAQKIATFVGGLVVVFAAAVWVGKAVGPVGGSEVQQAPAHVENHEAR